jgi:hypothetical protein
MSLVHHEYVSIAKAGTHARCAAVSRCSQGKPSCVQEGLANAGRRVSKNRAKRGRAISQPKKRDRTPTVPSFPVVRPFQHAGRSFHPRVMRLLPSLPVHAPQPLSMCWCCNMRVASRLAKIVKSIFQRRKVFCAPPARTRMQRWLFNEDPSDRLSIATNHPALGYRRFGYDAWRCQ